VIDSRVGELISLRD